MEQIPNDARGLDLSTIIREELKAMIDELKPDLTWMRASNLVDEGGIISPNAE